LIILTAATLCCVVFVVRRNHRSGYDIDEIERLSFYRDSLPIGSTRLQVMNFIAQHPIRNYGRHGLEHQELGSLQYPLGEVSGPYYCSRQVAYLYFVFSPETHGVQEGPQSPDDKLVEINLGEELQDCL